GRQRHRLPADKQDRRKSNGEHRHPLRAHRRLLPRSSGTRPMKPMVTLLPSRTTQKRPPHPPSSLRFVELLSQEPTEIPAIGEPDRACPCHKDACYVFCPPWTDDFGPF